MLGKYYCIPRPHPNIFENDTEREGHWGKQRCVQGLVLQEGGPSALELGRKPHAHRTLTSVWSVWNGHVHKQRCPSSIALAPKHLIFPFHMASISCPRRAVREFSKTDRKY